METQPPLDATDPPSAAGAAAAAAPRRDEWSDGAVACLLDAYESKWQLRSRAKLKARDWEDVARRVSDRAGSSRPAKSSAQCKNKVESIKKRYRSESAARAGAGHSRWPLFARIARLLSGNHASSGAPASVFPAGGAPVSDGAVEAVHLDHLEGRGDNKGPISQAQMEAEQSIPTNDSCKERHDNGKGRRKKKKKKMMQQEDEREVGYGFAVTESIQGLAEAVLMVEQMRMEAIREVEKMWAQVEAKKGELDLKRTEIIASTQLKIARLLCRTG